MKYHSSRRLRSNISKVLPKLKFLACKHASMHAHGLRDKTQFAKKNVKITPMLMCTRTQFHFSFKPNIIKDCPLEVKNIPKN